MITIVDVVHMQALVLINTNVPFSCQFNYITQPLMS